jgi:hypothetical protein
MGDGRGMLCKWNGVGSIQSKHQIPECGNASRTVCLVDVSRWRCCETLLLSFNRLCAVVDDDKQGGAAYRSEAVQRVYGDSEIRTA